MTFYIRYIICSREVERDESILYNKKINISYGTAIHMCKLRLDQCLKLWNQRIKGKRDAMQSICQSETQFNEQCFYFCSLHVIVDVMYLFNLISSYQHTSTTTSL